MLHVFKLYGVDPDTGEQTWGTDFAVVKADHPHHAYELLAAEYAAIPNARVEPVTADEFHEHYGDIAYLTTEA